MNLDPQIMHNVFLSTYFLTIFTPYTYINFLKNESGIFAQNATFEFATGGDREKRCVWFVQEISEYW